VKGNSRIRDALHGGFGDAEENQHEHVFIPRDDPRPLEELDVSSFADPEEGNVPVEPSRGEERGYSR
jgi:hypothetical protein